MAARRKKKMALPPKLKKQAAAVKAGKVKRNSKGQFIKAKR